MGGRHMKEEKGEKLFVFQKKRQSSVVNENNFLLTELFYTVIAVMSKN